MMKPRMRWAGNVARIGELTNAYKLWSKYQKRDHFGGMTADGRIILKYVLRRQGVDWIHLIKVRDQWRAVVNMVMNLRVS
jgi:hypothetical protein